MATPMLTATECAAAVRALISLFRNFASMSGRVGGCRSSSIHDRNKVGQTGDTIIRGWLSQYNRPGLIGDGR